MLSLCLVSGQPLAQVLSSTQKVANAPREMHVKFHLVLIHLHLKSYLWQRPPVRQHSFRAVINSWLTMLS